MRGFVPADLKEKKNMAIRRKFGEVKAKTPQISEEEQRWLNEEVEIEFYNIEEPGMMNKFSFGTTKDFTDYELKHGQKVKLPRKVIKHIESRQTPLWAYEPDGKGHMT